MSIKHTQKEYECLSCKKIDSSGAELQLYATENRDSMLIVLKNCDGKVWEHFGGDHWEMIDEWRPMLLAAYDKINSEEDFERVFKKDFAPLILNYRSSVKSTIIH